VARRFIPGQRERETINAERAAHANPHSRRMPTTTPGLRCVHGGARRRDARRRKKSGEPRGKHPICRPPSQFFALLEK